MFGISGEHLLILGIILLIVGPRRLPELGHTLGKAFRNFKDSLAGVEEAQFRRLSSNPPPVNKPDAQSQPTKPSSPVGATHEPPSGSSKES